MNNLNMTAAILTERKNVAKGESAMTQPSAARSSDKEVMRHLSRSQIFKNYERAFSEATGLPLNIRAYDSWSSATSPAFFTAEVNP